MRSRAPSTEFSNPPKKQDRIPFIPPRRLVFSGGGIRVVSYLGVLQALHERGFIEPIKEYCGVSAGSLIALMMALGYSLTTLERFCFEYNFGNIRSVEPETAFEFFENYGLDDGKNLEGLLIKILQHRGFSPNTTFQELAGSGRVKSLRVWAADIQNLHPTEFSVKTTPNTEIIFALRASMAIPLYFMPLKHPETGTLLVDGGVFDNYPIHYLTEQEAEESLGITFEYQKTPIQVVDFSTFISLLSAGYYIPSYQSLLQRNKHRTIVLPCAEVSALDFEMTLEEKQRLVSMGRQVAESFFSSTKHRRPVFRRHSVS
jgi:predicted acylesterase/phospholipase RssA